MRIAIIAAPYLAIPPVKYGGIEQVIAFLVSGLKKAGHTPILLAPADSTINCEIIPICDKAVIFAKTKEEKPAHDKLVAAAVQKTKDILHEIKHDIDIIHSHGFDLLEFQDVPNITTLHGPFEFGNLDYFNERKNLFYASISKNQQAPLPDLQYAGIVYNGLDPAMFPIVEQPADYLCFLGRFDREKNPHLAIKLAISMNMKIKIAGKIDFAGNDYFEQEIKPFLDHPLVEYLGELNFEDKVKLISNAKCNLHPASGFREPFGLSVMEAAYCGTPTLAIDKGSMPELIEDGRTGILVEDFIEGVNRIQECFDMDRTYIANRSRMLFNYDKMTEQYIIAYTKVIEAHKIKMQQRDIISTIMEDAREKLDASWNSSSLVA
jgi:glycosyltransferase involved in cell wall biosynthesis